MLGDGLLQVPELLAAPLRFGVSPFLLCADGAIEPPDVHGQDHVAAGEVLVGLVLAVDLAQVGEDAEAGGGGELALAQAAPEEVLLVVLVVMHHLVALVPLRDLQKRSE